MSHIRPLGFYDGKTLTPIRLIAETVAMFGRSKSEIELLQASLAGDAQAFGTVIDKYASLICAITYSATGRVTESEELAQETFLRAWKGLEQLRELHKFRPWLCRIARSTVQNWFRHQKRDVVERAAPLDAAADKASDEFGPVEAAMNREQQAVVSAVLAQIPENLREPLILFYREQQSTKEVAAQLGLSEDTARQRISRARSMLRAEVATMVETTITRGKPGKAFKTAVIAALAGTAVKTTSTATAGILSTLAVKATLSAAGIVLVVGTVLVHRHITTPDAAAVASEARESVTLVSSEPEVAAYTSNGDAGATERSSDIGAAPVRTDVQTDSQAQDDAPAAEAPHSPANRCQPPGAQPQGVLSGVITDGETGEPVPNALVQISAGRQFRTKTNAEGLYRFDEIHQAGNFDLSVDALTHVGIRRGQENPVVNLSNDKQVVQNLRLSKACMADVWVADQNGVGIPDAMVVVTSLSDDQFRFLGAFADRRRTDPNGYVLVGGIPPGAIDYLVTAWHRVKADGQASEGGPPQHTEYDYAPGRAVVRLPDPNVIAEVTVVLTQGQNVAGYAEYANGEPAAGVRLSFYPRWWHCSNSLGELKTADDGTFTFDHAVAGTYDISWNKPFAGGFATLAHTIMQTELPPIENKLLIVRLPENAPLSQVSIRGTVTWPEEATPEHIGVAASSAAGAYVVEQVQRRGDGTGTFNVKDLEPGTYNLTFSSHDLEDKVVRDVVAPSADLVVEMVWAPRPILTGTVRDARTGKPIPRFRARVRWLQALRDLLNVQPDRWTQFDDPEGRFSLETVGPAVYDVQVRAEGYAPRWSEPINTDESTQIQVLLTTGGTIAGQVVDEKGKPIGHAKVIPLSHASGTSPRARSAFVGDDGAVETIDGTFRLSHLPPGLETLKVSHPDYAPTVVGEIPVQEGESTDGVQIVLSAGAVVEGYVYDGKGRPLASETIVFQETSPDPRFDEGGRLASVATDSNGFYRVMHLPEKPCCVRRGSLRKPLGVVRRTVVPSADHITRLDLGGVPIVAGVVILDGVAQANTTLRLNPADPLAAHTFSCYAMTDAEGVFAFNGVVPGTHTICYQLPGKLSAWQQIATVEVGDRDVNVGIIPAGAR